MKEHEEFTEDESVLSLNQQGVGTTERLRVAEDAYYNGTPIMSDEVYDALKEAQGVQTGSDTSDDLTYRVGAPVTSSRSKIRHIIPMGSLDSIKGTDDLKKWLDKCGYDESLASDSYGLCVSDKLDGASISLEYVNGMFVEAASRGDGVEGEDVTVNAKRMTGVPATIEGFTGFLRGEVVCTHLAFSTHFMHDSNPRNTAAGTMRRHSGEGSQHLTVYIFNVRPEGARMNKLEELEFVASTPGLLQPTTHLVGSCKEAEDLYDKYNESLRSSRGYDIDGLVVEFIDSDLRNGLGSRKGTPRGAKAIKFPSDSATTILHTVDWQLGKSGRITPVANFSPVVLGGVTTARASLHSVGKMIERGANVLPNGGAIAIRGSAIIVSRRGDVIPYVEKIFPYAGHNATEFLGAPNRCPVCETTPEMDGAYLVCPNDDCEGKLEGSVKRWINKVGVLHFGEELIDALFEAELIQEIPDLYRLTPKLLSDVKLASGRRFGRNATRAYNQLHSHKELPLYVVVGSMGIPGVGRSVAKTILQGEMDLEKLTVLGQRDLVGIEGIGPIRAKQFVRGIRGRYRLIKSVLEFITIVPVEEEEVATGPLDGLSFCFTGTRDKELIEKIKQLGGEVKKSVTAGLSYLVVSDLEAKPSSKVKKATKHDVSVVDHLGAKRLSQEGKDG